MAHPEKKTVGGSFLHKDGILSESPRDRVDPQVSSWSLSQRPAAASVDWSAKRESAGHLFDTGAEPTGDKFDELKTLCLQTRNDRQSLTSTHEVAAFATF